jgi:hypothetical protein
MTRDVGCTAPPPLAVILPASANIFGAGHARLPNPGGGGAGTPPLRFDVAPGATFGVSHASGTLSCCSGMFPNGPDGRALLPPCEQGNITSTAGIAGVIDRDRVLFVAGVFLDDTEPTDPPPPRRDAFTDESSLDVSPDLRQVFFVGDGVASSGAPQRFHAPAGATRLYLGFADAQCFTGAPGHYDDNVGVVALTLALDAGAGCRD